MILKDLSFALRNVRRNKLLAAINVLGLSIGISACLVIFLIARYEMGFDKFQPDKDRIYRIYSVFSGHFKGSNRGVPTGVPVAIMGNVAGIESLTNFHNFPECHVEVPVRNSHSKDFGRYNKIIISDPDYFEVFNYYEWIVGDPKQSLSQPFHVVISESRARMYFGEADPLSVIGREIVYQDSLLVTVSGVVKDIEERTDLDFTDFISFSTVEKSWLKNNIQLNAWNAVNSSSQLFIKLVAGTRAEKIENELLRLPEIYEAKNQKWDEWRPAAKMQPLDELHFNSELGLFDSSRTVMDESTLYILTGVAGLLLIIAVINFINLETAQASMHAKEVGIRKVLGSSRRKLISRFLSESFILCALAVTLSVLWVKLSFNYFPDYIPEGLQFHLANPAIIMFLVSCIVAVTFLAGLYPAFVMSSYQPALALKSLAHSNTGPSRSSFIRKGLTIFQFSFSQIFVAGALVIALQLNYMMNKDLGFDPQAVLYVNAHEINEDKRFAFNNELNQIPEIEAFGAHSAPPVSGVRFFDVIKYDNGKDILEHRVDMKHGDTSYLRIYGIHLIGGRNVLPIDSIKEVVINESYMHLLGFTDTHDVIGETIGNGTTIVGVVKDFHTESFHTAIAPAAISYSSTLSGFGIKLVTPHDKVGDIRPALSKVEAAWRKLYPHQEFKVSFMTDTIKRYYENEQRTGKIATMSTVIALVISCLGLFGLSSFTVIQRTKEIGIRKVLGASVNNILMLLSRDFLKLVLISFILSAPIAYYFADKWLQAFAYRMELSAWIFVLSGLFSVMIAFATISFRTINAAKADPVKSLRYE
jgi:putative ABC transport system permease protein